MRVNREVGNSWGYPQLFACWERGEADLLGCDRTASDGARTQSSERALVPWMPMVYGQLGPMEREQVFHVKHRGSESTAPDTVPHQLMTPLPMLPGRFT